LARRNTKASTTKQISFSKNFRDVVEYLEDKDKVENISEFVCIAVRERIAKLNPKPEEADELELKINNMVESKVNAILEAKLKDIKIVQEVPRVINTVSHPVEENNSNNDEISDDALDAFDL
jgi:hypothetical protein